MSLAEDLLAIELDALDRRLRETENAARAQATSSPAAPAPAAFGAEGEDAQWARGYAHGLAAGLGLASRWLLDARSKALRASLVARKLDPAE